MTTRCHRAAGPRLASAVCAAAVLLALAPAPAGADDDERLRLRFIGEVRFETGTTFKDTVIGGLSGIDYDRGRGRYYAISDDRGTATSESRFYDLTIDLSDGSLDDGDITFTDVTTILDIDGQPFEPSGVDPESIRYDPESDTLYWTSEGDVNARPQIDPFVREMTLDGSYIRELQTPEKFLPTETGISGIRNNLAFESLSFADEGEKIFTATENALNQDGPPASLDEGSPTRFLRQDVSSGRAEKEFVYVTEPIADEPDPPGNFATNGLVEILALDEDRFLTVERSFSVGIGNAILLFVADLDDARNVSRKFGVAGRKGRKVRPIEKTLLLDLGVLGITLDNIEGVTFGPRLPSGERSLILVSDNNFNPGQFTQFLAFAVKGGDDDFGDDDGFEEDDD